jgi:hypothetical protein
VLELLAFALLVVAVSSLWRDNLILTLVMLIEVSGALLLWHDRRDISFLLVVGGMGSLAEAAFVRSGAWHYANPSILGIPMWFPVAFGTAGLILGRLTRTIAALWEARASQPSPGTGS